ncbi:hypothetical protein B0H14DRAFT_3474812 [Mycena olivaceomarginata]|nr:hypothetical protein B0H14DRAFT_3474812 [Mycena olivaceomarginata]
MHVKAVSAFGSSGSAHSAPLAAQVRLSIASLSPPPQSARRLPAARLPAARLPATRLPGTRPPPARIPPLACPPARLPVCPPARLPAHRLPTSCPHPAPAPPPASAPPPAPAPTCTFRCASVNHGGAFTHTGSRPLLFQVHRHTAAPPPCPTCA